MAIPSKPKGVLDAYAEHLPLTPSTPSISLGEGNTPLVRSRWLEQELGCAELYFKLEGCNPTGSFKDRGMVVAVAKAIEHGSNAILCASTGNTSASAAAYGAHCNLQSIVLVPKGSIALGKFGQAFAYDAKVIVVDGNFDQALQLVRSLTEQYPISLVNSLNPNRIEGQKTAAFEIVDNLGEAPDILSIPVGNAGNITAYWKGFKEYRNHGLAKKTPKMMGFQAEGSAPIVLGKAVDSPQTIATAIRIGNPASWNQAVQARDESKGIIAAVNDTEILESYKFLAAKEGIFGEPASAASVAGLRKLKKSGESFSDQIIVCVITGTGLKDPETATVNADSAMIEIPPRLKDAERALGLG
ncbi:threonine synthase [Dehalococcoidia bacterium]|nr:threonine synthase [Dehalococcoidia bacterium]